MMSGDSDREARVVKGFSTLLLVLLGGIQALQPTLPPLYAFLGRPLSHLHG